MDKYQAHRLASQTRAEYVQGAFNKWSKQPVWKKVVDVGAVATAAVISINLILPDMHKELEEWNPDYQSLCYTHNEDADGLDSRVAFDYAQELYSVLRGAGSYGSQVTGRFEDNLANNVLCVGPAYKDQDVARWLLTGVTIVDENYTPTQYAYSLAATEFDNLWSRNIDDMEEMLVYKDALLYSRFQRAVKAVELVDMQYRMAYRAHGFNALQSAEWQDVLNNPEYGPIAAIIQNGLLDELARHNLEYLMDPENHVTDTAILRDAFVAYMQNGAALNDGDIDFLRRYYSQMEDEEEICTTETVTDSEGNESEEEDCDTIDVAPPYWVHSRHITGEIVAELSTFAHQNQGAWLDPMLIESMMRDPQYIAFYSDDAQDYDEWINYRIDWYNTDDHDTHRPITTDNLYDGYSINQYHEAATETPRPRSKRYGNHMN